MAALGRARGRGPLAKRVGRVTSVARKVSGVVTLRGGYLSTEVDQENGDIGRGDSGNAGCLGDGAGTIVLEFLTAFD